MRRLRWRRHWKLVGSAAGTIALLVVGVGDWRIQAVTTNGRIVTVAGAGARDVTGTVDLFDGEVLHQLEITFAPAEYDRMIKTFQENGTKEWIQTDVVIDGTRIDNVGLRLKGNSSLFSLGGSGSRGGGGFPGGGQRPGGRPADGQLREPPDFDTGGGPPAGRGGGFGPGGGASADEPERLPWLIRFDEFVDGQTYNGHSSLVVRSSSTATAANEALALELVELAGEPAQDSIFTSLAVNGSAPVLRLAVELPDERWDAANFGTAGVLYKALSSGDWSYRGEDPLAYADSFDQETAKKQQDLAPLIAFLDFLDSASDARFETELADHLDVESFARYLALQDLIGNFDDIGGPGNNSYLRYDLDSGRFTVLTWDLNLAFSGMGAPGGARFVGGPGGGGLGGAPGGGGPGGGFGRGNILEDRFRATDSFSRLYDRAVEELRQDVLGTGDAQGILEQIRSFLAEHAAELVDSEIQVSELDRLAGQLETR